MIFKNTIFTEHLWLTASILQQLVALYFAIIYRWQLSGSENYTLQLYTAGNFQVVKSH